MGPPEIVPASKRLASSSLRLIHLGAQPRSQCGLEVSDEGRHMETHGDTGWFHLVVLSNPKISTSTATCYCSYLEHECWVNGMKHWKLSIELLARLSDGLLSLHESHQSHVPYPHWITQVMSLHHQNIRRITVGYTKKCVEYHASI